MNSKRKQRQAMPCGAWGPRPDQILTRDRVTNECPHCGGICSNANCHAMGRPWLGRRNDRAAWIQCYRFSCPHCGGQESGEAWITVVEWEGMRPGHGG